MPAKLRIDGGMIGPDQEQFWYVVGHLRSGRVEGSTREDCV